MQISRLEFIKCSSIVELVDLFTLECSSFHGENDASALQLTQTNAKIEKSSFTSNAMGTYQNHIRSLRYFDTNTFYPVLNIKSHSARVGGALVITSSNIEISSSHFSNNVAEMGGAIFSQLRSKVTIRNCIFANNSVTDCSDDRCQGGALFVESDCTVRADASTIANNTSERSGGAIALFQGIFIENCSIFISNKANRRGGAISAYDRCSIIIHSNKYVNTATSEVGILVKFGGGVVFNL